jgi:hypothetical protein
MLSFLDALCILNIQYFRHRENNRSLLRRAAKRTTKHITLALSQPERRHGSIVEFLFLCDGENIGVLGTLCTHFCQTVCLHKPTTFGNWNSNYDVPVLLFQSHTHKCAYSDIFSWLMMFSGTRILIIVHSLFP